MYDQQEKYYPKGHPKIRSYGYEDAGMYIVTTFKVKDKQIIKSIHPIEKNSSEDNRYYSPNSALGVVVETVDTIFKAILGLSDNSYESNTKASSGKGYKTDHTFRTELWLDVTSGLPKPLATKAHQHLGKYYKEEKNSMEYRELLAVVQEVMSDYSEWSWNGQRWLISRN